MESNFYSDEFEQLIREKTEQYKMYPSEKVWKGVHGSLHTKRRWFIAGMSLLVTGILLLAGKELIMPSAHTSISKKTSTTANTSANSSKTTEESMPPSSFASLRTNTPASTAERHSGEASADPEEANQSFRGLSITISNPVISQPDLSEFLSKAVSLPTEAPSLPVDAAKTALASRSENNIGNEEKQTVEITGSADNANNPSASDITRNSAVKEDARTMRMARNKLMLAQAATGPTGNEGASLKDPAGEAAKNSPLNTLSEALDQQRTNWLQDYALYNLPTPAKKGRKYWQLYVSPTINYRSLSGDGLAAKTPPVSMPPSFQSYNAKDYIQFSPGLGLQLGGNFLYRVTRNLTFKAGLQFSFNRYTASAYTSSLPRPDGHMSSSYFSYYQDSLVELARGRNVGDKRQVNLSNDYYQLSAPIGFELRVLGNERLQLHLGATIQPTYLLNTNEYILTPDYYNYGKNAAAFRHWNINAGLETFLSYKTRGVTWQIGPEFRYQLLSTYNGQYPIQEHLKSYGLKIGIIKAF